MISERAEHDPAEGAMKKDHGQYLKKRPPRLPEVPAFGASHKKNKIKNAVPSKSKSGKRLGVWVGKREAIRDVEEEEIVLLSPESVDNTEHSTANVFAQATKNQQFFDDDDDDDDDAVIEHLCDDSDDDNWMEEWGAVTIQSLFRGHFTRKRVKRLKKRMLKVKQMKKHRRHRKRSKEQRRRESGDGPSRSSHARRACQNKGRGHVVRTTCKVNVNQTYAGKDDTEQQSLEAKPRRRSRKDDTTAAKNGKRRGRPPFSGARPSTATVRDALAQLTIMRKKNTAKVNHFSKHANQKAIVIQKVFRGYNTRLKFLKKLCMRLEVEKTKEKLLQLDKKHEANKRNAATTIQKIIRGSLSRQKCKRMHLQKCKRDEILLKHAKATKIQALVRGYKCRCGIINLVEQLAIEEQNKAIAAEKQRVEHQHLRAKQASAKIIQKIYRGFHARANPSKYQKRTKPGLGNSMQGAFVARGIHRKSSNAACQRSKTTSPAPSATTVYLVDSPDNSKSPKSSRRKRRAPQVLLTTAMLKSNTSKSPAQTKEKHGRSKSTSPNPFVASPGIEFHRKGFAQNAEDTQPRQRSPKNILTSPVTITGTQDNPSHQKQCPKSEAIQKKKDAKARFENRARINPMVDEPVYDFESLLSGLWEGESLDNHGHVTTIFDCVLRFYKDTSNGQAMIEGRAKTRSGNDVGVIIMQGVFDWGSSRCILVVEGKNCQGGYTYMGWLSPPSAGAPEGDGAHDSIRTSSLPIDVPLSPTSTASNVNFETSGHGVGYTLEASFQQSMLHLKKKSNTRRSEMRPIRQLMNNARSRSNIGRPSSNDRTSSTKKLLGSIVTTPEKRVERMMTDVSAMLSNFKYQMEAVKRQTPQNGSKVSGAADIHSIVALMTELEAKLPSVQSGMLLSSSGNKNSKRESIWSPNFIRGNSKDSNRAKSSKIGNKVGFGNLESNVRLGSSSSLASDTSSRLTSDEYDDDDDASSSSSLFNLQSSSRESSPTSESEQQSRTVTPIQSHYKHLFSGDRKPHEYGVHWKSSASPIHLVSKIRRRATPGMFLAPMSDTSPKKKKMTRSGNKQNKSNKCSSSKKRKPQISEEASTMTSSSTKTKRKLRLKAGREEHHANKEKSALRKETSNLLGKLKIRNKVLQAEAEIKMKREQQYQMDKEALMKMSEQTKRKSLETVDEYERW